MIIYIRNYMDYNYSLLVSMTTNYKMVDDVVPQGSDSFAAKCNLSRLV